MSGFVSAGALTSIVARDDQRLLNASERLQVEISIVGDDCGEIGSFVSLWWPKNGLMGDGLDSGVMGASRWGPFDATLGGGASSRFGFVGVTRDQFGTPIPSCTVKLFRTSDDLLLDTIISDPNGNFLLNTAYYPNAHYIVSHKSGSPDVDGATVNTLIGT